MSGSRSAHPAAAADQEESGSEAGDSRDSAAPWEVAGRRDSEAAGMHLYTQEVYSVIL